MSASKELAQALQSAARRENEVEMVRAIGEEAVKGLKVVFDAVLEARQAELADLESTDKVDLLKHEGTVFVELNKLSNELFANLANSISPTLTALVTAEMQNRGEQTKVEKIRAEAEMLRAEAELFQAKAEMERAHAQVLEETNEATKLRTQAEEKAQAERLREMNKRARAAQQDEETNGVSSPAW